MTENAFFAAFFFSCTAAVLIFAFKYASGVAQAARGWRRTAPTRSITDCP